MIWNNYFSKQIPCVRKTVAHAGKEVFGVEDNNNVVQWARAKCVYAFGILALL